MYFQLMYFALSGHVLSFPDFPGCTNDPLPVPVISGVFRIFPLFSASDILSHNIVPFHVPVISGFCRFGPTISQLFPLMVLSWLRCSSAVSRFFNFPLFSLPSSHLAIDPFHVPVISGAVFHVPVIFPDFPIFPLLPSHL